MKVKSVKDRYAPVRRLIAGYMSAGGIYPEELAQKALQKEAGAVRRRLENPERMSLGDYLRICRTLQIPIEEARGAISYDAIGGAR